MTEYACLSHTVRKSKYTLMLSSDWYQIINMNRSTSLNKSTTRGEVVKEERKLWKRRGGYERRERKKMIVHWAENYDIKASKWLHVHVQYRILDVLLLDYITINKISLNSYSINTCCYHNNHDVRICNWNCLR